MRMIILVYVLALLLISCPVPADAFEYDVDWPTSGNGKHVLAITINGCETRFIIEDKNLQAFTDKVHDNSSDVSSDLIKKARDRAANGCKN